MVRIEGWRDEIENEVDCEALNVGNSNISKELSAKDTQKYEQGFSAIVLGTR